MVWLLCWMGEFHDFWWLTLVPQHVQRSLVWWMQGLYHDYNWYVYSLYCTFDHSRPLLPHHDLTFNFNLTIIRWSMHYPGCPEHNTRQSLPGDTCWNMYYPRFSQSAIEFRLNPVFQDEVTIEPGEVIAVLAAATLLALEGLISQVINALLL